MWFNKKTELERQLNEYIVWKSRIAMFTETRQNDLYALTRSKKSDICFVTPEDLEKHREYLLRTYNGHYSVISGMLEVRSLLKYLGSRKYKCLSPETITSEGFVLIYKDKESIMEDMAILEEKKVNKGGRGKVELLRNTAIATLRKADSETFTSYSLAKLFNLSGKRILQICDATKPSI